jgi:hypothetical protein
MASEVTKHDIQSQVFPTEGPFKWSKGNINIVVSSGPSMRHALQPHIDLYPIIREYMSEDQHSVMTGILIAACDTLKRDIETIIPSLSEFSFVLTQQAAFSEASRRANWWYSRLSDHLRGSRRFSNSSVSGLSVSIMTEDNWRSRKSLLDSMSKAPPPYMYAVGDHDTLLMRGREAGDTTQSEDTYSGLATSPPNDELPGYTG